MKKHKTYGFWISLSGATVLVVQIICEAFGVKINSDEINQVISSICGILVMLGILMPDKVSKNNIKEVGDINIKSNKDSEVISKLNSLDKNVVAKNSNKATPKNNNDINK